MSYSAYIIDDNDPFDPIVFATPPQAATYAVADWRGLLLTVVGAAVIVAAVVVTIARRMK